MRALILAAPLALMVSSLAHGAVCNNPATGRAVNCPPPAPAAPAINRTVVLSGPIRTRPPRCRSPTTGRLGPCAAVTPSVSPQRTPPGRQGEPLGVAPLH